MITAIQNVFEKHIPDDMLNCSLIVERICYPVVVSYTLTDI